MKQEEVREKIIELLKAKPGCKVNANMAIRLCLGSDMSVDDMLDLIGKDDIYEDCAKKSPYYIWAGFGKYIGFDGHSATFKMYIPELKAHLRRESKKYIMAYLKKIKRI